MPLESIRYVCCLILEIIKMVENVVRLTIKMTVPIAVPPKRFEEPDPAVPTWRLYCVTPDPAVQAKVAPVPRSVLPGAGEIMVADAGLTSV